MLATNVLLISKSLGIKRSVTVLAFGKRQSAKARRIVKLNPLVRGRVSVTGSFLSDHRLDSCDLQGSHTRSCSMIGGLLAV